MSIYVTGPHLPSPANYAGFPTQHPTVQCMKGWFTDWFRGPYIDKLASIGAYDLTSEYTPPDTYRRNYQ